MLYLYQQTLVQILQNYLAAVTLHLTFYFFLVLGRDSHRLDEGQVVAFLVPPSHHQLV